MRALAVMLGLLVMGGTADAARAADALVHDNALGAQPGGTPAARSIAGYLAPGAMTLTGPDATAVADGADVFPSNGSDWLYDVTAFPNGGTWDPADPASAQVNARQAATQLFYFVNRFHDHLAAAPIGFAAAPVLAVADAGAAQGRVDAIAFAGDRLDVSLWSNGRNPVDDPSVIYGALARGMVDRTVAADGLQSAALAAGWSDWYALDFLAREGYVADGPGADVRFGAYLDPALRAQPIDAAPGRTYADVDAEATAVADGEVWGQTLWQLRETLIARHGAVEGVRRAEAYVTDGLRAAPAQPSFLDARNALLAAADEADRSLLWPVFAARGMGYFASTAGAFDSRPDADFSSPPAGGPRGSVSGVVRDELGAPLAGAEVSLAGPPGLTSTTDAKGAYRIAGVPFATYPRLIVGGPARYAGAEAGDVVVAGAETLSFRLRRNYAGTVAGGGDPGCGPDRLADGAQATAVRAAAPAAFTVQLAAPVAEPEVRVDPGPGCGLRAGTSPGRYTLLASADGITFTEVGAGRFDRGDAGRLNRLAVRGAPATVRAVRLVVDAPLGGGDTLTLSELQVLARSGAPTPTATPYAVPTPKPVVRVNPRLIVKVTPKHDRRRPFAFTTTGTVVRPASVPRARGCKGRVRVSVQRRRRLVGSGLTRVTSRCRFRDRRVFRRLKPLGARGKLTFTVRFQGNLKLKPRATKRTVRYGSPRPAGPTG